MASAALLWPWARTTLGEEWGSWGWNLRYSKGGEGSQRPLGGSGVPRLYLLPPRALLDQVEHWQSFLALVNMIMFCTGIPGHYPVNETTSSLTLTFWYTLQVCLRYLQ